MKIQFSAIQDSLAGWHRIVKLHSPDITAGRFSSRKRFNKLNVSSCLFIHCSKEKKNLQKPPPSLSPLDNVLSKLDKMSWAFSLVQVKCQLVIFICDYHEIKATFVRHHLYMKTNLWSSTMSLGDCPSYCILKTPPKILQSFLGQMIVICY